MKSTSKATTLFNLKDEYLKAKTDSKCQVGQAGTSNKKLKDIIGYKKAEKDKKQIERNAKALAREKRLALTEREEADLARSRSVLEAKSAVYDKLLVRDADSSDNILVNFSGKRASGHSEIAHDYNKASNSGYNYAEEEEVELGPAETHFSNVDHGEVRSKGVGFYSFSENPELRKQQMSFLNSMRESTEKSREMFAEAKTKRRDEKLARLNRLMAKWGKDPLSKLPNEPEVELESYESVADSAVMSRDSEPVTDAKTLRKTIEEQFLIREQTLWEAKVEELRNEREMEFAPGYEGASGVGVAPERGRFAENDEIEEDDDAIVNFISFVRNNT